MMLEGFHKFRNKAKYLSLVNHTTKTIHHHSFSSSLFLSFKDLILTYLSKTSIKRNNYLTFLFQEDNSPVSAKAASEIWL